MIKNLEDFQVYQKTMELGEDVWNIVKKWDYFSKDTIGKQLVRAVDSIASNLSEGLGLYHYKERGLDDRQGEVLRLARRQA